MSKLPSLTPKELIKILEKKGFIFDRSKGSHRIYYNPQTNKRVVIPFHVKDLPKGTLIGNIKTSGDKQGRIDGIVVKDSIEKIYVA